ncbi:MAG: CvpA family protein [Eubacteriaceae bacterium]
MTMGYDIICLGICIIFAFVGYKRGAIKTLISIGGFIASFIIAWMFAPSLGEWLMQLDLFKNAIEALKIKEICETIVLSGFQGFGDSIPGGNILLANSSSALSQGVEALLQFVIAGFAQGLAFGFIMLMMTIVIGILQKILGIINWIPIIGGFNRLIGLVFGGALGAGCCIVITGIFIWINMSSLGSIQLPFLESSQLAEVITSWISSGVTQI